MTLTVRNFLVFCVTLVFVISSYVLFTPKVPDDQQVEKCISNVRLSKNVGYWLNCDSSEFLRLSDKTEQLLETENVRQSRPGLIYLAKILSYPIGSLLALVGGDKLSPQNQHPDVSQEKKEFYIKSLMSHYFSYIVLNFLILLAGFWFFLKTFKEEVPIVVWFPFLLMLIANDVVKAYFLSPHTQMFNITYSLAAVYLSLQALKGKFVENLRWTFNASLAIGLLMLVYSSAAALWPCMVLASLVHQLRSKSWRLPHFIKCLALSIALVVMPSVLWMGFLYFKTGGFYHHEYEGGLVVWIAKSFEQGLGGAFIVFLSRFMTFLKLVMEQILVPFSLLLVLVTFSFKGKMSSISTQADSRDVFISCGLAVFSFLVFYYLVGFYVWRIAYSVIPPFLVMGVHLLNLYARDQSGIRKNLAIVIPNGVALSWFVYSVVKYGPTG